MSLIIKDAKMPIAGQSFEIAENLDGKIYARISPSFDNWHEIIAIPQGRYVNADAFDLIYFTGIPDGYENTFDDGVRWMAEKIDNAPTIISEE